MKFRVDVIQCDMKDCDSRWEADLLTQYVCTICGKDYCEAHAETLWIDFRQQGLKKTTVAMRSLCHSCGDQLAIAIKGAHNAVREQLEPIVRDCIVRLAPKVEEENAE